MRPRSTLKHPFQRYLEPFSTFFRGYDQESEKTIWGCGAQWQQHPYSSDGGTQYDNGWQSYQVVEGGTGQMAGCFVYQISINRISPASGTVSVSIGCMRNGSFTRFGTYQTGQKVVVMWPIMTTDAVAYQCSERVDVQLTVIAYGGFGDKRRVARCKPALGGRVL